MLELEEEEEEERHAYIRGRKEATKGKSWWLVGKDWWRSYVRC